MDKNGRIMYICLGMKKWLYTDLDSFQKYLFTAFIIKYGIVLNFVNLLWLKHVSTFIQGFIYSQCLQCVSPLPCISIVLLYGQHC